MHLRQVSDAVDADRKLRRHIRIRLTHTNSRDAENTMPSLGDSRRPLRSAVAVAAAAGIILLTVTFR